MALQGAKKNKGRLKIKRPEVKIAAECRSVLDFSLNAERL
jgi:hypothetical protein